jgi:hypothetical protein
VETPRKFITAFIYFLRGVSTNKTIICFIAMQTYKELIKVSLVRFPPATTLDKLEMTLTGPLGRTV